MNVGPVSVRTVAEDRVERAAAVGWAGGEFELRCAGPRALADTSGDASGFVCAVLPLAMRLGEDLEAAGPVSPLLLERLERVQVAYAAWDPGLRPVAIRAGAGAPPGGEAGRGAAVFLSRGVDSLYAAARAAAGTTLVFVDGLEPRHDASVRAEEERIARDAAGVLDRPVVSAWTNLRELTDGRTGDWEDHVGPALAFLAHQLAGGLERVCIPSTETYATVEPCGTSPLVDPLLSTERVVVEHDGIDRSRLGKVRWLVEHRPELLPHLKVCWKESRPDNCGRCPKCLLTMACLQAAGALALATAFPPEIDLDAVREIRFRRWKSRVDWVEAAEAEGQDPALRDAVLGGIRTVPIAPPGELRVEPRAMRDHRLNRILDLGFGGGPAAGPVGVVRAVADGRHVYGLGALPGGAPVGELGALPGGPAGGTVPVWLTADGRLVGREPQPPSPAPGLGRAVRWVLAPLAWRGLRAGPAARLAAIGWRARRLLPAGVAPPAATGRPVGRLHVDAGPGRLPLYSAYHPFTGDQLLTTSPHEAGDLGYGPATLLGHLEAHAPVTGRLGIAARPRLVWASRFGQRVRD